MPSGIGWQSLVEGALYGVDVVQEDADALLHLTPLERGHTSSISALQLSSGSEAQISACNPSEVAEDPVHLVARVASDEVIASQDRAMPQSQSRQPSQSRLEACQFSRTG